MQLLAGGVGRCAQPVHVTTLARSYESGTEGDAFVLAFFSALDAVSRRPSRPRISMPQHTSHLILNRKKRHNSHTRAT